MLSSDSRKVWYNTVAWMTDSTKTLIKFTHKNNGPGRNISLVRTGAKIAKYAKTRG